MSGGSVTTVTERTVALRPALEVEVLYGVKLSAFLCGCLVAASSSAWAESSIGDDAKQTAALTETDENNTEAQEAETGETSTESSEATAEAEVTAEGEEEEAKPWRVGALLSQDIGIGAFVEDEFARNVNYGYAAKITGSYKVMDKVSVVARIDFDQRLVSDRGLEGTSNREFFFRETRLGVSGSSLYTIPLVDVAISANTSIRLPTDKNALANGRYLGWTAGLGFKRAFEDIGPGTLTLSYSSSFRYNIAEPTGNIPGDLSTGRICRVLDGEDCSNAVANTDYSFGNGLTVEYAFLEDFSVAVALSVTNSIKYDLSSSNVDDFQYEVGRSQNARPGRRQSDLLWGTIEVGYSLTDNFSLALGALTVSNPFINNDGDQYSVRNPFWDTESTANNLTSIYFDVAFSY